MTQKELKTFGDLSPNSDNDSNTGEIDLTNYSDVAAGDKVKYIRPNLDKKEDVLENVKIFDPDMTKGELTVKNKKTFYRCSMKIFYESKNADGVQNGEYVSGIRQYKQQDGSLSEHVFWYPAPDSKKTQVAKIWEAVAKFKKVEPDKLSNREFLAFILGKPKVEIESQCFDNWDAPAGAPPTVNKNMVGKFI